MSLSRLLCAASAALASIAGVCAQPNYAWSSYAGQVVPAGSADGTGSAARFNRPLGVTVAADGTIYVADAGNDTIRVIRPGNVVSTLAGRPGESGTADGTGGAARFSDLRHLALDASGAILAADGWAHTVRRITPDGTVTTLVGGPGHGISSGPVSSSSVGLLTVIGVAVTATGEVYLSEVEQIGSSQIRKLTPDGVLAPVAGSWPSGLLDGSGTDARFRQPWGLALDTSGNVLAADRDNAVIRKITPAGVVSTFAGTGTPGSADGAALDAQFNLPSAVAVDAAGNVYVADTGNNAIRKIDATGAVSTLAGIAGQYGADDGTGRAARFQHPQGLALDPSGNLIVADTDNNLIRRVTAAGVVTTLAGSAGMATTDGTLTTARFVQPSYLALDPAHNLYVADPLANVIRKISATGVVTTLAGTSGLAGATDGTGAAARFSSPRAIAVDAAGAVFVADVGNWRIRQITPDGVVTTLLNATGPAWRALGGIAVDSHGAVYVSDTLRASILKVTAVGTVTVFAGSGAAGTADGTGTVASFAAPGALAIDRNDVLYVADAGTRIRRITPAGVVTTLAGSAAALVRDGTLADATFADLRQVAVDAGGDVFVTDGNLVREITAAGQVVTLGGHLHVAGYADGIGGAARFSNPLGLAVDSDGSVYVADAGNAVIRKAQASSVPGPPILTDDAHAFDLQKRVAGDAITLHIAAAGLGLTTQWYRDGVALAGATNATLSLTALTSADTGRYTAVASNVAGSVTLDAGMVTVYTPAAVGLVSRHVVPGAPALWGIAAGSGALVAVGAEGTLLSSDDGVTWTPRSSGTNAWLVAVAYGGGQYVAVGDHAVVLRSNDGISWTADVARVTTQRLNNVLYAAGQFVAVGEAGTILTSADATTWTLRTSGVTTWLRGLAYDPASATFATSGQGGVILVSSDAVSWWRPFQLSTTSDLEALVAVSSYASFIAAGGDGTAARVVRYPYFSKFGGPTMYLWGGDASTLPSRARFRGLVQAGNGLFLTGENGTILSAPDLSGPWATLASGTTANLLNGAYVGNTLYLVGENETILASDPLYGSRLVNISTRGQVSAASPLIAGFVVQGTAPKQVLIRAAGPALAPLGVNGALAAPRLTVFDQNRAVVGANAGWNSGAAGGDIAAAANRVGAFPFATGSGDAAVLLTLPPGGYTAQISTAGPGGVALVEAYDVDPLSTQASRAINLSTRGYAASGGDALIAGFVIRGTASRRVLIRAVGPSLAAFGVPGTLPEPQLALYDARGIPVASAQAWSNRVAAGEVRSAGLMSGAFPLAENSADSALVLTLPPGGYTAQVTGVGGATGNVLVEVYDLP